MDSRINSQLPTGPVLQRKLGERSPRREPPFVLPRRDPSDEEEQDDGDQDDRGLLSPQPRGGPVAVSRVRLEDEAGQRIDLRG